MDILADENIEPEWRHALVGEGHDVVGVVEIDEFEPGPTDHTVLTVAADQDRVLLTADQADFSDPPMAEHSGIVIVNDTSVSGDNVRKAVRRIDRLVPDLAGQVLYLTEWL